jgi:type II secretory pathway component PulF
VSVEKSLTMLIGRSPSGPLDQAVYRIRTGVAQGKSFSQGMLETGVFPIFTHRMCVLGEITAQLPKALIQLADLYEHQSRMESEFIGALMYPLCVMLLMLGVMVFSVTVVLPSYAQVFAASARELPALTRSLLRFSAFFSANASWFMVVVLALTFITIIFISSKLGRNVIAYISLYAPVIRTVHRHTINLRFTQALCMLLDAGQSIHDAAPVCAEIVTNLRVRSDLLQLAAMLRQGRTFWESLKHIPYMDPMLSGMAQVGEATGSLPYMLNKCREHFEQTYTALVRHLNKLVEPIITIVLGGLLLLVMLAVILPTFSLTSVF